MGNRSRSESKRKQKKTPPHQGSSSSSPASPSPARSQEDTTRLSELDRQLKALTASRVQSAKDYASAHRGLIEAVKEFDRTLDEEERQAFQAARAELDAQRAEVKRIAEEAAERRRYLEEELQQLRDRITEAKQLGNDYLLPILEGELQQLQPLAAEARQEHGACRRELKHIQQDLRSLTASKRFADQERRAYHEEMKELDRRSREEDEFERECRRRDVAWERDYRKRSKAEEKRAQQEQLPLELP